MKKRKIAFLVMTLVPIYSFSQTTSSPTMIDTIHLEIPVNPSDLVSITDKQLKIANLIFLEHEKMFQEIPLLEAKISNLEKIDSIWHHTDSVHSVNETNYINTILNNNTDIQKLKKEKNILFGTSITGIALFLLSLFL